MQRITNYTLEQNLIIKKAIPSVGIICSNPRRAERIALSNLKNVVLLNEYNSAWPLDVYVGNYRGKSIFVAGVAVGAAGAAFAIQQLAVAGAKYIIRYGSNDDPNLTMERMNEVVIVEQADNLYGLMQSSGAPVEEWGGKCHASSVLINDLCQHAQTLNLKPRLAICHHIEDYAAYAFPAFAGDGYSQNIQNHLQALESQDSNYLHTRDMETAALFFRAKLDGFHAATVLQNVPKFAGKHQTYDGQQGNIARELESVFSELILSTLTKYADDYESDFRTYIQLNEKTIVDYLKTLPASITSSDSSITEIGDGNLNNIFRVKNDDASIVVKQALTYLRCVGPEYDLNKNRMQYEIAYMQKTAAIAPDHVPKLYHADGNAMMAICMQDLNKHEVLRDGLIGRVCYPNFANHISTYLAEVLFKTSRLCLSAKEHFELVAKFNNNELCQLTRNFVFTFPYFNHETNYKQNNHERFSSLFRINACELLQRFSTHTTALIHGDLHTGSIMLNQEETFVIDGEFGMMGPIGFDPGHLIANFISAWVHHGVKNKDNHYQAWLLKTIEFIYKEFNAKFSLLWERHQEIHQSIPYFDHRDFVRYRNDYLLNILQETIGFAGLELCRRTCGIAGVKEIRGLQNSVEKGMAESIVLRIGQALVENYKTYGKIETLILELEKVSFDENREESVAC